MLVQIPGILTKEEVAQCRAELDNAPWTDGRATAGYLSQRAKDNDQIPDGHPVAQKLGKLILLALDRSTQFTAAALPLKVLPPQFNRYTGSQRYGRHIDGAIRAIGGTSHRVRTDLAATLFLAEPDTYDGGELVMEDTFGPRSVKLPAGDMVLYPGTSVHHIAPVTRGTRFAAFFWTQSLVRDDAQRKMLFELDGNIQSLAKTVPDHPALVDLAGLYHNLIRMWADT